MRPPLELIPAELLLRIAREGIAEMEWRPGADRDARLDEMTGRFQVAFEAVRCATVVAQWQKEHRVLPLLCRVAPLIDESYDEDFLSDNEVIAGGVERLLESFHRVTMPVRKLSRSGSTPIRAAVAKGLKPEGEEQIAILCCLASDPQPVVRQVARESLGGENTPPWWEGVFDESSDDEEEE